MKFQNYLTVFRKNGCSEIFIKISRKVLMVEFGFNPNMGGRGLGGGVILPPPPVGFPLITQKQ